MVNKCLNAIKGKPLNIPSSIKSSAEECLVVSDVHIEIGEENANKEKINISVPRSKLDESLEFVK